MLDPAYDCYEPAIDLAGARPVHVPLDPATFAPDWQRVKHAITPPTRLLMLNSPPNPSGAFLSSAAISPLPALLPLPLLFLLSFAVSVHTFFPVLPHYSPPRPPS